MDDIGQWLEDQRLGKYRDLFEESEIAFADLGLLTEDDIRELNLPLGPRRRLLAALDVLRSQVETAENEATKRPEPNPSGDAERRQLTVMFCDLVGSTSLSETMDTEDYRDLLSAYQSAAATAIQAHDGYIARYMGDGLLVYFGYPVAQENDPERAARAGLAIIDAVTDIDSPTPLEVRVGIATGPVVVGDIVGEGASEEAAVLGETPNLAARLQSAAAPNTVLLSPTTRQLLHGRMETEALEPVALKGLSRAVVPHRALRPRSLSEVSETRLDTIPLIGRDVELALLDRAWRHTQASEGQIVLLSGEAGVGKSRLLRAFQEQIGAADRIRIQWHCSPYYQTTANYPAIEQLKRTLAIDEQSGELSLEPLVAMVEGYALDSEMLVPAFALLLSIPLADRYIMPDWSPDELKRRLLSAQVDLLVASAQHAPVLFVIEDLHWADPTTLEVLGEMVSAIRDQRVLILTTARPEFDPPWAEQYHATTQRLSSLSRTETIALVRGIAEAQGWSSEVLDGIVKRTDGVPLYVEELTNSLVEFGTADGVPASLQDSLMARLDGLGTTKELAQMASIIGRNFSLDELTPLAERAYELVVQQLGELVDSGLVRRLAGGRYEFKHALVRDAAYDSMLRGTRRSLHRRLATHLFAKGIATEEPELLARHCTEAGMHQEAVESWRLASQLSEYRAAFQEAIACLTAALAALARLTSDTASVALEIDIRVALRNLLLQTGDMAGTRVHLLRAEELADQLGDIQRLGKVSSLLLNYYTIVGDTEHGQGLDARIEKIAAETRDLELRVTCRLHLGQFNASIGAYRRAIEFLIENVTDLGDDMDLERYGLAVAPSILSRVQAVLPLAELGDFETASALLVEATDLTVRTGRPLDLAYTKRSAAFLALLVGDGGVAARESLVGLEICRERGINLFVSAFAAYYALALIQQGQADAGHLAVDEALSAYSAERGSTTSPPGPIIAEALLLLDRKDEALVLCQQLEGEFVAKGLKGSLARTLWVSGECHIADAPATALHELQRGREIAGLLGMRPIAASCDLAMALLQDDEAAMEAARRDFTALGMKFFAHKAATLPHG